MISHSIQLRPFQTPNFVLPVVEARPRQEGLIETPPIPLASLSVEALDALCRDFRAEVFAKAGKADPA